MKSLTLTEQRWINVWEGSDEDIELAIATKLGYDPSEDYELTPGRKVKIKITDIDYDDIMMLNDVMSEQTNVKNWLFK
jgi:hypothetical protein